MFLLVSLIISQTLKRLTLSYNERNASYLSYNLIVKINTNNSNCLTSICISTRLIEQGLTSHQTHCRSYRERFLQVIWPNQQYQSIEGNQLVFWRAWTYEKYRHHTHLWLSVLEPVPVTVQDCDPTSWFEHNCIHLKTIGIYALGLIIIPMSSLLLSSSSSSSSLLSL